MSIANRRGLSYQVTQRKKVSEELTELMSSGNKNKSEVFSIFNQKLEECLAANKLSIVDVLSFINAILVGSAPEGREQLGEEEKLLKEAIRYLCANDGGCEKITRGTIKMLTRLWDVSSYSTQTRTFTTFCDWLKEQGFPIDEVCKKERYFKSIHLRAGKIFYGEEKSFWTSSVGYGGVSCNIAGTSKDSVSPTLITKTPKEYFQEISLGDSNKKKSEDKENNYYIFMHGSTHVIDDSRLLLNKLKQKTADSGGKFWAINGPDRNGNYFTRRTLEGLKGALTFMRDKYKTSVDEKLNIFLTGYSRGALQARIISNLLARFLNSGLKPNAVVYKLEECGIKCPGDILSLLKDLALLNVDPGNISLQLNEVDPVMGPDIKWVTRRNGYNLAMEMVGLCNSENYSQLTYTATSEKRSYMDLSFPNKFYYIDKYHRVKPVAKVTHSGVAFGVNRSISNILLNRLLGEEVDAAETSHSQKDMNSTSNYRSGSVRRRLSNGSLKCFINI